MAIFSGSRTTVRGGNAVQAGSLKRDSAVLAALAAVAFAAAVFVATRPDTNAVPFQMPVAEQTQRR